MKKTNLTLVLLASLAFGACGSDDDNIGNSENVSPVENKDDGNGTGDGGKTAYTVETVEEEPAWRVDWSYNQTRPDWQEPLFSDYENWTVISVEIEDELKDMTSSSDLLAVLIDNEVCGLANPAISIGGTEEDKDTYTYLLKVYSNRSSETYQNVTLKYYSNSLHQVFTSYAEISFSRYDDISELVPSFVSGAEKFSLAPTFQLLLSTTEASGVKPAAGDRLAAFVGDECRGVCTLGEALFSQPVFMQVYGKASEETVTLKYYHAATQRIFTFAQPFSMDNDGQPISLNF